MVLPWSHRLPDYAFHNPNYGQNLVELARLLAETSPLTVMDIGANVGDSALQILHAADGKVLCVEGDTAYLEFLHLNVDADERITVVEALLAVDDVAERTKAVRTGGTTRFESGAGDDAMPSVTPAALRAEFPDFADLRLVKSDTDGYDVLLVPAVAREWADAHPVLFFEYDPYLIRIAGQDHLQVWEQLRELGYTDVAVWDNGGAPVGRMTPETIGGFSGKSDQLNAYNVYRDDPGYVGEDLARYGRATPADLQAAAATWLSQPYVALGVVPLGQTGLGLSDTVQAVVA